MVRSRVRDFVRVITAVAAVGGIVAQASAGWMGAPTAPAPLEHAIDRLGFAADDVATLQTGRASARQLETEDDSELGAVGVILVPAPVDAVVESFRNLSILRRSGMAECAGRFSTAPNLDDLACLDVPAPDLVQLPKARVGDSDVKLSEGEITALGRETSGCTDAEFKRALMHRVLAWQQDGIAGLGTYADKKHRVAQTDVATALVGALERERPEGLQPVERFEYWAVERFGSFKPLVDVNSMSILSGPGIVRLETIQLYASHYCNGLVTSVDLMPVVTESGPQTLMRLSFRVKMDSLGGIFGGLKRKLGRGRIVEQVAAGLEQVRAALVEG